MHKILLIIKREYLSRVKKKAFLLVTFLMPLLFVGLILFQAYLVNGGMGDKKNIAVIDESAKFQGKLKNDNALHYSFVNKDLETVKKSIKDSNYDYILYIPASMSGIQLLGEKKPSMVTTSKIEDMLTNIVRQQRLQESGIDTVVLALAQKPVSVKSLQLTANGTKDSQSGVAYIVGFISGVLVYLTVLLYGIQVMRGVIEEKVSRIIEVIISAVKPFQLMMGKIIGIGLVGLTQFVLIITLSVVLTTVGTTVFMKYNTKTTKAMSKTQINNLQVTAAADNAIKNDNTKMENDGMPNIMQMLDSVPLGLIICCFLFYFLSGYFLYSAVFAAVGSAVDSETETQQFMLPVTFPLLFTYMISFTFIINNPDSPLSVWLSIIPFTSPIAMMVRLPFGVPAWQLAVSMLSMIGGFIFTIWAAARIYRVGILMYGKKASYKELAKWFRYKE